MTSEAPQHSPLGLLPTRAGDGRTMIGHVVVCQVEEEIAIWHVSTEGVKTGAWVRPLADVDADEAQRLLDHCRRRALLAWQPVGAAETLRALEIAAGVGATDWAAHAVAIPEVLVEVVEARDAYVKLVTEEQAANKQIKDLEWPVAVPDPVPGTPEELRRRVGLAALAVDSAAVTEALLISRLAGWVVQRWRENAVALGRREYLRTRFGQPTVLAPQWEQRLADAYA